MMKNKIVCFLIALCSTYISHAQDLSFNLPFIHQSAEPELFFLEPNYNEAGKVNSYSFGNLIKVQYEYDRQNRPEKKTIYVMDRYSTTLNKLIVTNFEYRKDRLVQEATTQYDITNSSPYYTFFKNISYDAASNTDTIKTSIEWFDKKQKSNLSSYVNSNTHTIRYLNKHNLPDSITQIYKLDEEVYKTDISWETKSYYKYDNKNRLISCKIFAIAPENKERVETGSYNIKYDKNKVEYLLSAKIPDFDSPNSEYEYIAEDEDNEEEEVIEDEYKTIDETLKYTITTDSKGRIVSKYFTHENDVVLDCKYSYDANGKTNANHEQHLSERFMRFYGFLGIGSEVLKDLGRELEYLKYITTYKGNCSKTEYFLKTDYSEDDKRTVEKKLEISSCYEPVTNNLLSFESIKFYKGKIDDHDKTEFKYNEDGSTERITYIDGNEPYRKFIFRNDTNGKKIYEEIHYYDEETKQWIPDSKTVNEYNKDEYKIREEEYHFEYDYQIDNPLQSKPDWKGKEYREWKLDDRNRILEKQNKRWRNDQWNNYDLYKYTYAPNGEYSSTEEYSWSNADNIWVGVYRDSVIYSNNDKLITRISYKWIYPQNVWEPTKKEEAEEEYTDDMLNNTYTSKNNKTNYRWDNDKWIPQNRTINQKDVEGFLYEYSKWDTEKQNWQNLEKKTDRTSKDRIRYLEQYNWNHRLNELTGQEYTISIPLSDYGDKKEIHKIWNRNTQSWTDTIACTILYESENRASAYIYEIYDKKKKEWQYNRKIEKDKRIAGQNVFIQSSWDEKSNKWVPERKIINYLKDRYENQYKSELYIYDTGQKIWTPVYMYENLEMESTDKEVIILSQWNNQKGDWQRLLSKTGRGWNVSYYLWDRHKSKFIKQKDENKVAKMMLTANEEFDKLDYAFDYRSLVEGQY